MSETLRKLILDWYKYNAKDAYRERPEIFEVLSSMVTCHVANAYYIRPPSYVHPATWILALVGPQGRGKSTIMRLTGTLYNWAKMVSISPGSPEAIIEEIHQKVKEMEYGRLYLFWDEAGSIKERQSSYLSTLEYWINQMYYSSELEHRTRTRNIIKVPRDSYMINLMFGAINDQWAEIERTFDKGFGRRTFPILLDVDLPLLTDIDFSALVINAMLRPRLMWALKQVAKLEPIIALDGVSKYDRYIKRLTLPLTKKMALSEYGLKFAIGRMIGEAFEVPEEEEIHENHKEAESWAMEHFLDKLENWAQGIYVEDTNGKILREKYDEDQGETEKALENFDKRSYPQILIPPKSFIPHLIMARPELPSSSLRISLYLRIIEDNMRINDDNSVYRDNKDNKDNKCDDTTLVKPSTSASKQLMNGKNPPTMSGNEHPQPSGIIEGFYTQQPLTPELTRLLDINITEYTSPASFIYALHYLTKAMVLPMAGPSPELTELKYRIDTALRDGAPLVMSYTNFIKTLFHTNDVGRYEKLLQLAGEAQIIRIVQGYYKRGGRYVRYVILDPTAKICGNCIRLGTKKCPLVLEAAAKGKYFIVDKSVLLRSACDNFELEGGEE